MSTLNEEIILDFMPDGTVVCNWWTKQLHKLMKLCGFKNAKGFESLNDNPWCG